MHPEAFYGGGGLWLTMAINILTGGLEHLWDKIKQWLEQYIQNWKATTFGFGSISISGSESELMVNEGGNQEESASIRFNYGRDSAGAWLTEYFNLESKSGFMTLNLTPMYTTIIRNKTDSDMAIVFILPGTTSNPTEVDTENAVKITRYSCDPIAYTLNIPPGDGVILPRPNATGPAFRKAILYWN